MVNELKYMVILLVYVTMRFSGMDLRSLAAAAAAAAISIKITKETPHFGSVAPWNSILALRLAQTHAYVSALARSFCPTLGCVLDLARTPHPV